MVSILMKSVMESIQPYHLLLMLLPQVRIVIIHRLNLLSLLTYRIDADGLRDVLIDRGWVIIAGHNHQSPDNYLLLGNDDVDEIDEQLQSQITRIRFAGKYGEIQNATHLDLSAFKFSQLQVLQTGYCAFPKCKDVVLQGRKHSRRTDVTLFTDPPHYPLDLLSLQSIVIGEGGFPDCKTVLFESMRFVSLMLYHSLKTNANILLDLPSLQSIILGSKAFIGDRRGGLFLFRNRNHRHTNSLIMKSSLFDHFDRSQFRSSFPYTIYICISLFYSY